MTWIWDSKWEITTFVKIDDETSLLLNQNQVKVIIHLRGGGEYHIY